MNAINNAIYTQLTGGTALIAALGGTAIFHLQAPDNQPLPYVVFNHQGGGDLNITPSSGIEVVEFVRVYDNSAYSAGTIDALVRARLHDAALTVTGYTCLWCKREDDYETVENLPSGEKVYTMGGLYRISIT